MTTASLSLRQFKSYKDATLPLAPLTLLIGANASGKSNAIEAFRLLSWVAGGERLSTLKNRVNDSDKIIRGSIKDLAFNNEKQFALHYRLEDIDCEYEGVFEVKDNQLNLVNETNSLETHINIVIKNTSSPFMPKISSFYSEDIETYLSNLEVIDTQFMLSTKLFKSTDFYFNYNQDISVLLMGKDNRNILLPFYDLDSQAFQDWENWNNVTEEIRAVYFFDFIPSRMSTDSISDSELRFDGSNLAGVLHHVCQDDTAKAKLLALIQSLPEQNISDINFYVDHRERVEFALVEQFGETPIERTMDLLSDGTLKVLGIATALLSVPEGSTVVIEEIDNSIHPSRANQILTLMREYASERQLNLLLSTHNPALMDALPDEALADVVFCYRDPSEGDSRLVRLGDLDDYLGLVSQGSLGDLVTEGVVERFVKHPTTPEQRKQQALDWLKQMQGAD